MNHAQAVQGPSPLLAQLRLITPLFGVRQHDAFGEYTAQTELVDVIIAPETMRETATLSRLVAAEWRRRLATSLAQHHARGVIADALFLCGSKLEPPSTVRELAGAGRVSREHFARTLKSRGVHPTLCAKRLIDAFVVLQILVMRSMGITHRHAARESGIPYRTFLRARDRLEHVLPGSTENFRALMVHVGVRAGAVGVDC